MYKIIYFLEKLFWSNIQNCQHSSKKNVYIEYIEFYTLFEKIIYFEYTNYLYSLKIVYIGYTKFGIFFENLFTLNI